jgi:putative transposase
MKYCFIKENRSCFSVLKMCRYLKVSKSGYYDWFDRPESKHSQENKAILEEIKMIHNTKYKNAYGSPRVHRDLKERGFNCSKKRVARIMNKHNIKAKSKKKWKATTNSKHNLPIAANLLEQNFVAEKPNQVWTSDITYIWTDEGWLYLCVVLDLFSRKIVGWSMDKRMKKELVLTALKQAIGRRNPDKGLVFHSDRGSQYAAYAVRNFLKQKGFNQSMSKKGDCYDNAVTETFFHSLKTEFVFFRKFNTRDEAKLEIFDYIEIFYNRERRHSTLGYFSPATYEKIVLQKAV